VLTDKIILFSIQDENVPGILPEAKGSVPINPVRELEQIRKEVENQIAPSKWSVPENMLNEEGMPGGPKIEST